MEGIYRPSHLEEEGFIHCCLPEQLREVANSYKSHDDICILYIDTEKVKPEIIFEDLYNLNKLYPHIYGFLNLDAVVKVVKFVPECKELEKQS